MTARGLYRTKTPGSDAEYAFVDYGVSSSLEDTIPRSQYEAQGYRPPFDELPTKETYEARRGDA
jgi:hypothetical protein